MEKQMELFEKGKLKKEKKSKKRKPIFEMIRDGLGSQTIEKTEKPHVCYACSLPIVPGSRVEKLTPIGDGKPLWRDAIYRHLKPACTPLPLLEDNR